MLDKSLLRRYRLLVAIVLLAFSVFAVRLVDLQVIQGPELAKLAEDSRTAEYKIDAPRGDIVDAKGKIMATSTERFNVWVNQRKILEYKEYELVENAQGAKEEVVKGRGPLAAAKKLAPLLQMDEAILGGKLVGDSPFVYLKKDLTPAQWRQIKELNITGIEPEPVSARVYPNGPTAGTVIGFVNKEGIGQAGLEQTQDSKLVGIPGVGTAEIGRTGQVIPTGKQHVIKEAVPGATVHTSLRLDLQYLAQQQIDHTVAQFGAQWGAVVVEEVSTGKILVLADSGQFDPTNYQKYQDSERGSRAVQFTYEPGSTGKILTFAAALEQKAINPATPISCPYKYTAPNGQEFSDSHDHPTYTLTAAGVLAESSNTGTVQVGDLIKDKSRYELGVKLGYGQPSGVEMPAESAGIFVPSDKWDGRQRYTTMFGQGMAATLLQTSSMIATIGNKGVRVQPHVIDGWTMPDGSYKPASYAEPVTTMSQETASTVLRMMETVTAEGGTASAESVAGYRTAAKTGTTQILDRAGQSVGVVASFSGLVPADAPRVAVSVVIYRPTADIWGATVAGPVFKQVAAETMQALGVPPSTTPAEPYAIRP